MYRVALVASHVIQYQAPLFRLLAAERDLDLTVIYCDRMGAEAFHDADMGTEVRWDLDLLSGYRYVFLRNFGFGDGYTRLINPGIVPKILFGRFDAVLFFAGWGTITSLLGVAACRASNTPFFLFGDSSFPPPRQFVRDAFLRTLFRLAHGFLVSGALNADYYRHYGADERRFHSVPFAIDNERFARGAEGAREPMRAQLGVRDEQLLIVFSAKLVARKDPMTLLRAVDAMRHRNRATILFLGHGELRDELERFASEHKLDVRFAGFVNQTDLPRHYVAADVLVLPSTYEPRGLVVNEAMACGLPVIVSDRVGAIGDLVQPDDNAFVFPAGDAKTLASQLDRLIDEPQLRARMARRSREIVATFDYAHAVRGVREALASC